MPVFASLNLTAKLMWAWKVSSKLSLFKIKKCSNREFNSAEIASIRLPVAISLCNLEFIPKKGSSDWPCRLENWRYFAGSTMWPNCKGYAGTQSQTHSMAKHSPMNAAICLNKGSIFWLLQKRFSFWDSLFFGEPCWFRLAILAWLLTARSGAVKQRRRCIGSYANKRNVLGLANIKLTSKVSLIPTELQEDLI